jgi:DNA-directed RNA polymerase sigma subunit (sigma70/sigma32)
LTPTDIVSLENYQAAASEKEHQASVRRLVLLILKEIPRPEGKILTKRFGICTCKNNRAAHYHQPMTLDQIGEGKSVSRERIRQRLQKIFAKVRRSRNKTIKIIAREWESP